MTYTLALISERVGDRVDMDSIWQSQAIPTPLLEQIKTWSREINDKLHVTAAGRLVSEWAKKSECWEAVRTGAYSDPAL